MACKAIYIRIILEELGHAQPPTPLQTDNAMADRVMNGKVQPKQSKAMDLRFHWLCDWECQWWFHIYLQLVKLNYADYGIKHHPEARHHNMRKEFLMPHIILEMLSRMEQQSYAACTAWKSDHNDCTWQRCDDLSLARPDPWTWSKDRLQCQAPMIAVA